MNSIDYDFQETFINTINYSENMLIVSTYSPSKICFLNIDSLTFDKSLETIYSCAATFAFGI